MDTYLATDLSGTLDALAADPAATVLAGGTDLMVEVTYGNRRPSAVVAIRVVEALTEWSGPFIGAGVTYARMEDGPWPALAQAARTVGSPQIRNADTLGGNLATASPAGDALPFLAALDAEIVVSSRAAGARSLPWDRFITGPKRNALKAGEVILGARLPDSIPERQAFAKIGVRNAMVISIASCCLVRRDDGTTRLALGSVGPTPIRPRAAEEMISHEKAPTDAALDEFQRLVSAEVSPITDHRSTEAYRRHAWGILARRLLERVL